MCIPGDSISALRRGLLCMLLVVFLTAPAFGLSVRDNAFNGVWQDWGNGWKYCYFSSGDTAWWKDGDAVRLGYQYGQGQWWDYGLGGWNAIGAKNTASTFIGDGKWYDLKNGWSYYYNAGGDVSWWRYGTAVRFAYQYRQGQWWNYGIGGWLTLGQKVASSKFIGEGASFYDLDNGWAFKYDASADTGYWQSNSVTRFAYSYPTGQWFDYYSSDWHKLSRIGISSSFLGDGAYHEVWSDGAKYQYVSGYGYWSSSGVSDDDDFRINYASGQWYRYYDGSSAYNGVEYLGNRQYLLTDYIYWTSDGVKSTTPTGGTYGTDVQHVLWLDSVNTGLLTWTIFTPGSDLKWSGASLDIVLINNNSNSLWMRSVEQYVGEDVITIEYDLEGGTTLSTILQGLGYLTTLYGKTIDDLAVFSHGNTSGFYFGPWISTSNYSSTYGSSWAQLNTLMTDGGELQLYHCLVGTASDMLDDIASRTNTRVFANINSGWTSFSGTRVNRRYNWDDPRIMEL